MVILYGLFVLLASAVVYSDAASLIKKSFFFRGGTIHNDVADRWSLSGKRIVVTGGTLGIGKAIVEECACMGAEIITCARNEDTLRNCLSEWDSKGFKVHGCVADVSSPEGRDKLLNLIQNVITSNGNSPDNGKIDALVNNVGTNIRKRANDYTHEEYEKIMNTNLHAAFHLTRACYPFLNKESKGSAVVNIGSVSGGCNTAMKSGVVYAMTKAAMTQMTYNLACEWALDRIRVNTIAPWYIDTPLVQPVLKNPEALAQVFERTPMKRVGKPEEVSSLAAFLCLDSASFITGQVIAVDGGFLRNGFY